MARTAKRLITPEEYNKAARLKAKKMTKILLTFFCLFISGQRYPSCKSATITPL